VDTYNQVPVLSTSAGLTVYVSVQMFQRRLRVLDDSDDDDEESQRRARNRQLVDESTVSELQLDRQQTSAMGMTLYYYHYYYYTRLTAMGMILYYYYTGCASKTVRY